mgnify:CR=1 FL=1
MSRYSGWAGFLRFLGVISLLVALIGLDLVIQNVGEWESLSDPKAQARVTLGCTLLVAGLADGLASFFFAFVVDVLTDTRWRVVYLILRRGQDTKA